MREMIECCILDCASPTPMLRHQRAKMEALSLMRRAGRIWVIEELDKNSAELCFTCPRAWALLTYSTFQYWPEGIVAPG